MYFSTGAQLQAALAALPNTKTGNFVAFDSFFYGQQYMGDYQGTLSPIEHFVQIGAARGYKPNATFDPVYYANKFADLKGKGFDSADLLYHFMQYGLDEGRTPNAALATFDGTAYLAANPDVAAYVNANLAQFGGSATNGALAHYVKFGAAEGRTAPGTSVSNGQTFTLTTSATDIIVGTAGNDTIIGDYATAGANGTVQASDQIDGGAGVDNFKLYSYTKAADNKLPASIKNVEVITYVAPTGAGGGDAISVAGIAGVNTLSIEQADGLKDDLVTGNGQGLKLSTLNKAGAAVNWTASATDAALNIEFAGFNDDANTVAITAAAAATLNIASTGAANAVTLDTTAATKVATINVTGDKNLTLGGSLATSVVTLNSSAATGNVTATFGAAATATVTGGKGAETIDVSAVTGKVVASLGEGNDTLKLGNATINALSTFDGGAGTDTVQITDGSKLTTTTGKQFSNFEVLATGAGTGTYNVEAISGITAVVVDGDAGKGAAGVTIDKLTTQSVTISSSQTAGKNITLALKDATGTADSLTVKVAGEGSLNVANKLITNGIETVTVNSSTTKADATAKNTLADLDVTGATKLVFTGDYALTVTAFSNATTVTQIDASGLSKGLVMGAATGASVGGSYIGGAGNDTFFGNTKGDTFYGAGGGDKLTLGAAGARDTVTYKAASDSVVSVKDAALVMTGLDVITNFKTAEDTLNLKALALTDNGAIANKGASASDTAALAVILDLASGKAAATGWFSDGVSNQAVATLSNGAGDTYVFIDANRDGNFSAANDLVIKLTGTASLAYSDFAL